MPVAMLGVESCCIYTVENFASFSMCSLSFIGHPIVFLETHPRKTNNKNDQGYLRSHDSKTNKNSVPDL